MTDRMADALQTCLEAVDAGASVEAALNRQPELAQELRPLVLAALAVRARRPRPAPGWRARTEADLLARTARPPFLARWAIGVGAPGLAAALALLLLAGLSVAAAASRPGDALYPLKAGVAQLLGRPDPYDLAVHVGPDATKGQVPIPAAGVKAGPVASGGTGVRSATAVLRLGRTEPAGGRPLSSVTVTPRQLAGLLVVAPPTAVAVVPTVTAPTAAVVEATEPAASIEPPLAAPSPRDTAPPSPAPDTPTPEAPALPLPITPEGAATLPVPPTPSSHDIGVLSGHVTTADGDSVAGAYVTAYLRWGTRDLWWWIWQWDRTNAEGVYHLRGLPSGAYKVVAWGGPDRLPYQWHPAAVDPADAAAVALGAGETRTDVDVRFPASFAGTATPSATESPNPGRAGDG